MAYERGRRAEAALLSARKWREQPASMRWLLGVNVVLVLIFAGHLVEETMRGALGSFEWLYMVGPVLVLLLIGIWMTAAGNVAGVGSLFTLDAFIATLSGGSHLLPGSADHFGRILAEWGGATGVLAAALALALPLVALFGLLAGVWALMDVHDRAMVAPARGTA